jgi:hypothetical protein
MLDRVEASARHHLQDRSAVQQVDYHRLRTSDKQTLRLIGFAR